MGYFPIQCAQWLRQNWEESDYSPSKALNKHTIRKAKCGTASQSVCVLCKLCHSGVYEPELLCPEHEA